ncbi:helix-turn-helix domain-containing protein [Reyranella sp. CPCC 100927]|uniref:helix-turn-helix domain-containing protein n=1 Tax=Reyranella sp. CPCC 100927 TaxID=2599616 RepID=UPI0011B797C2|nr:AraC family transcriptional regulator [Reyranella sp. CPCC 100927]TWT14133.1 helix-turn-helix transcriptional regulator [Reyranella sp. CPCC 100927]
MSDVLNTLRCQVAAHWRLHATPMVHGRRDDGVAVCRLTGPKNHGGITISPPPGYVVISHWLKRLRMRMLVNDALVTSDQLASGANVVVRAGEIARATLFDAFDVVQTYIPACHFDEIASGHASAPVRLPRLFNDHETSRVMALMTTSIEAANTDCYTPLLVESLGRSLTILLAKRLFIEQRPRGATHRGGLTGARLERAKSFVAAHYGTRITVSEIARAAGYSPYHFARSFKMTTGMTPFRYIQSVRLDKAKEMLLNSYASLNEIAVRCGFSDGESFSQFFRRVQGIRPGIYRQTLR